MLRRHYIWLILIPIIAWVLYDWRYNQLVKEVLPHSKANTLTAHTTTTDSASSKRITPAQQATKTDSKHSLAAKPTSPQSQAQKFQAWFDNEADNVDRIGDDSLHAERRLKKVAAQLNRTSINYLLSTATNPSAAANQQVMAVYLLTLSGSQALHELADIASSPLPEGEVTQPDSLTETSQMQSKALRVMAIDSLAEQAKRDVAALNQLKKAIATISDPYLRAYARKKLANLKR